MLSTNQFRFTPPTHTILAFKQGLLELEKEGGTVARYKRYSENHRIVRDALVELGFKDLVPLEEQSKIINTFFYPKDKNFKFEEFYQRLSDKGKSAKRNELIVKNNKNYLVNRQNYISR